VADAESLPIADSFIVLFKLFDAETESDPVALSLAVALKKDAITAATSDAVIDSEINDANTARAEVTSEAVADSATELSKLCPAPGKAANGTSANADVPNTHQAASRLNV
jgi:hypothetical protein